MPSLKEVKERITSVNSTMQITSAMKMVSAAKLKKAQDAITQMRPYAEKLQDILSNLSSEMDSSEGVFAEQREVKRVLVVAITSNRGLCGAFNSSIIKRVGREINETYADADVHVVSIGKKALDAFKRTPNVVPEEVMPSNFNDVYENLVFDEVARIAEQLMAAFASGHYDKVVMVYNRFKNAAVQEVVAEQFLPVLPPQEDAGEAASDYIFEPEKAEILEMVIPKTLKTQLYKGVLDSFASEHGARMTAMHKATDNASDLLKDLRLTYNKARQASITKEILEIVGGAEALNG